MKKTGITRPIDELGRIVIPKELRKIFDINDKDLLEIYVENDSIILKKHTEACIFCGNEHFLSSYNEKYICQKCLEKIGELSKDKDINTAF